MLTCYQPILKIINQLISADIGQLEKFAMLRRKADAIREYALKRLPEGRSPLKDLRPISTFSFSLFTKPLSGNAAEQFRTTCMERHPTRHPRGLGKGSKTALGCSLPAHKGEVHTTFSRDRRGPVKSRQSYEW
ncbi:hypothetical protein COOONC_02998 [Cooperia oncophora]